MSGGCDSYDSAFVFYLAICAFDRQLHLDLLFDVCDECLVQVRNERDRFAFLSCPTGSSDSVHVIFGIAWHVVVDDLCDVIDVDSACGKVCCDEDVCFSFVE